MQCRRFRHRTPLVRQGGAAVELAVLLPFLMFIFVITIDWGRIFYYSVTLTNCAQQGALYGCDSTAQAKSPYTSIQNAALADASNMSPQPTITSKNGTDSDGNSYIEVTATYQFTTVTNFPGVGGSANITRTSRMRIAPTTP